jgi:DNA-binding CsgD family transcriptional regulator
MGMSTSALTRLNHAILAVRDAPGVDAFAAHLLHALRLIVPGDIRVADFSGIAEIRAHTAYDPGHAIPAEVDAAVHRHLRDNPLYGRRNARATSISDLLTKRQWRRTALFGEAYARAGQEDGLALDLALGHGGMLTLNVTRSTRGWSAVERTSLGLLGPHAQAHWRRLRAEQRWGDALARSAPSDLDTLSAREREVLGWVAGGRSNAEIATLLGIRAGTVKRHLENVYRKLGVSGRRDAAVLLAPLVPRADRRDH